MDNLKRFPSQFPDYDIESVVINLLEISQSTVLKVLEHFFEKEYKDYYIIEFVFTFRLLLKLPEGWLLDICGKDTKKIPPLFGKLLQELVRVSNNLPNIAKLLLSNFPDNEYLQDVLIHALTSGTRVFIPGTEATYEAQALTKLKKWKLEEKADVILNWIDKAIEDLERKFREARIRDEEAVRQSVKETDERDIEFYEMYAWLNKMKKEYEDETIAFAKIGNIWTILSHSKDNNLVYQEINEKFKKGEIDKEVKVRFKSFKDEI